MCKSRIISFAVFLVNVVLTIVVCKSRDAKYSHYPVFVEAMYPTLVFLVPSILGLGAVWFGGIWYRELGLRGKRTSSDYIPAFAGWVFLIVPIVFNILALTGVIWN